MFIPLKNFRQRLYAIISKRCAATLDLIDALSSHHGLTSITQLSLSPLFRRKYNSITKVINEFELSGNNTSTVTADKQAFFRLTGELCPQPVQRDFFLFGTDVTPALRPYSPKLADKGIVYHPTTTPGNKPTGVGHAYSLLAYLPEKNSASSWLLPLDTQRVTTSEKGHEVGIDQFLAWISENASVIENKTCAITGDSSYFIANNQQQVESKENLILISRMKSNRNVYEQYQGKGNKKYVNKMKLNDPASHVVADQETKFCVQTTRGKHYEVEIKCWHNRIRRGTVAFKGYEHPFNLLQCVIRDTQTGKRIYQRPLWLSVCGQRRFDLRLDQVFDSYGQRYDLEHYFRFAKQHLLIDAFQTSQMKHEQNGWQLTQMAYLQLYLAREDVTSLPNSWERYLPKYRDNQKKASPSQIKKCFDLVLDQIGTPAHEVLSVKAGKGRQPGETQKKRQDHPIIFKTKKQEKDKKATISISEKAEKPKVSGLELPAYWLKPQKFSKLLDFVKDLLKQSEIDFKEFAEKLEESEVIAT